MDLDTKLTMSLDQLIKTDTETKKAVKTGRFQNRRRGRQTSATPAASNKPKVKKDPKNEIQKKKDNRRNNKPARKDSDVEMKTSTNNKNENKKKTVTVKKVILTTRKAAKSVMSNERRKIRITNIPYDVTWR